MGRHAKPFYQTRRAEMWEIIKDYAEKQRTLPTHHAIWEQLVNPVMHISFSRYRALFDELLEAKIIERDARTGAIAVVKSDLTIFDLDT